MSNLLWLTKLIKHKYPSRVRGFIAYAKDTIP